MAFDLSFLNNYKNKKLIVKNNKNSTINISDLKIILNPSGTAGDSMDLLKQDSITKRTLRNIKDIHDSRDLQLLVVTGIIDLYDENGRIENTQEALSHGDLSTLSDIPENTGGGGTIEWGNIGGSITDQSDLNNALDGKANSVHNHDISDVTNLQTSLNGKANTSHTHTLSQITDAGSAASKAAPNTGVDATITQVVMGDDTRLTNSRTPTAHNHAISDVDNLQTTLNGKANSSHTHTKAQITDFAHTHTISDVTNLQNTLNNKEDVIADGDETDYFRGDKTWQTLNKAAVGLGNVDNTSDMAKPISSAVSSALSGKANTSHNHNASDITSGTLAVTRGGTGLTTLGTANQVLAVNSAGTALEYQTVSGGGGGEGAWGSITGTLSDQTDLNNALNAKANTSHTHTLSQITDAGSAASKAAPNTGVDATTTQVVMGDDTRLTNSRTPTAHVHNASEITGGILTIARGGTGLGSVGAPNTILGVNGAGTLLEYKSLEDIGGAEWGSISGTLSSQTDLNNALNGKANTSHTHNASDITAGTLPIARGGTGLVSLGTPGQVLTTNNDSSGMSWTTPSGGGSGGGSTHLARVIDLQAAEYSNAYSFDIDEYLDDNELELAMHNVFILKNLAYPPTNPEDPAPTQIVLPVNLSAIPEGTTLEIRAWNEAPGDTDTNPSEDPTDIVMPSRPEDYWTIFRGSPGADSAFNGVGYFPSLSKWDGYCKLVVGKHQRRLFDVNPPYEEIGSEYYPTWILVDYMIKRPDGAIGSEYYY